MNSSIPQQQDNIISGARNKVIYTTGVFDLLHLGHLNILLKAKSYGTTLVVGIQGDISVYRTKGEYPILTEKERVEQLEMLPFVDETLIYYHSNQIPYYQMINPHVVVQGSDWFSSGEEREKMATYLRHKNIELVLVDRTPSISTSEIKRRIAERSKLLGQ